MKGGGGLKQRGGTDQPDVIPGRVVLCCERATETARRGGRGVAEGRREMGRSVKRDTGKRWRDGNERRNETERKRRRKIAGTTALRFESRGGWDELRAIVGGRGGEGGGRCAVRCTAAIVFVIIKNAIRNCKLENGRARTPGGVLFMGCSLIFMRRN